MNFAANIWKLYLIKMSKWFMVYMPVVVLFFESNGLNMREVMTINAIYSLSVALFEIPSGYFSDKLGRKNSIILGTILIAIHFLAYSCAFDFWALSIGAVIGGLGASFISGTDSAMLFDTLCALDRKGDYLQWEGRSYALGTFSEAVAAIIGGWLAYYYNLRFPMYVQVGISCIGIVAALLLVEPPTYKEHQRGNWEQLKYILVHTFFENKQLRFFITLYSVFGLASLLLAWFAQPYFDYHHISKDKIGYLWAALSVTVAFFSLNVQQIARLLTNKQQVFVVLLGFSIGYVFLGLLGNILWLGITTMFVMYALRGIATPTFLNLINQQTPSDMRATVLSIKGFVIRILYALLAPILGWLTDVLTILEAFLAMSMIIGFASIISIGFYSLILQKK